MCDNPRYVSRGLEQISSRANSLLGDYLIRDLSGAVRFQGFRGGASTKYGNLTTKAPGRDKTPVSKYAILIVS